MAQNQLVNVALFLDHDLQKAQFAIKYLAAQMAVRPVMVYAMLRNGCDSAGKVVCRAFIEKVAEVRRYLQQAQHTFNTIQTVGKLYIEEIAEDVNVKDCVDSLFLRLCEKGKDVCLFLLEDGITKNPWTLEGEKIYEAK